VDTLEWLKVVAMPLATVVVTVVGGWYFNSVLKDRENRDTNERMYSQLLVQREQSDASIRKDMFAVVLKQFLEETPPKDWNERILQLELLAHNFAQSLDLAPLFKDISRRLPLVTQLEDADRERLQLRLDNMASALNFKQVNALKRRGYERSGVFPVGRWATMSDKTLIYETVPLSTLVSGPKRTPLAPDDRQVVLQLELLRADLERREIEVRLQVDFSGEPEHSIDRHFWVGQYDFPMMDNVQLAHGLRASVVVTEFTVPPRPEDRALNSYAAVHLLVFPAASASFKERQDYDDVLLDMVRNRERAAGSGGP
jgi:hypothetical protein